MNFENSSVTLFEVSWEVCNKVGGIHSVVTSKALQAVEHFGEDYFLLGPALKDNPGFEETDEHAWDSLRIGLATRDLKCRLGRWNIPGRPKVILVDFDKRYASNLDSSVFAPTDPNGTIYVFHASAPRQAFVSLDARF